MRRNGRNEIISRIRMAQFRSSNSGIGRTAACEAFGSNFAEKKKFLKDEMHRATDANTRQDL